MGRKKDNKSLVWSSDGISDSQVEETDSRIPQTDGIVRVSRQTKGRKGKGVTLITGVPLAGAELKDLAKLLKQKCGSGGTIKDGTIEVQGDHRDLLVAELKSKGWVVRKSGG